MIQFLVQGGKAVAQAGAAVVRSIVTGAKGAAGMVGGGLRAAGAELKQAPGQIAGGFKEVANNFGGQRVAGAARAIGERAGAVRSQVGQRVAGAARALGDKAQFVRSMIQRSAVNTTASQPQASPAPPASPPPPPPQNPPPPAPPPSPGSNSPPAGNNPPKAPKPPPAQKKQPSIWRQLGMQKLVWTPNDAADGVKASASIVKSLILLPKHLKDFGAALVEAKRPLGDLHAGQANTFAKLDAERLGRNIQLAGGTAGTNAGLAKAVSKLENRLLPIQIKTMNLIANLLTAVIDKADKLLGAASLGAHLASIGAEHIPGIGGTLKTMLGALHKLTQSTEDDGYKQSQHIHDMLQGLANGLGARKSPPVRPHGPGAVEPRGGAAGKDALKARRAALRGMNGRRTGFGV